MKKNESYDFTIPRRQSYVAILLIAYKLYKVLLRQLFPFILIFIFGGKLAKASDGILYVIIGLTGLGAIYSILSFFKYRFYLKDNKLVINKGVFKRSVIEIPFDRIQSVNFEQNLIHRVFNVVKLNMDTAGSSGNEMQLNALNRPMATALSDHILKYNSSIAQKTQPDTKPENYRTNKKVIFNLSILQLLKVGITANHLRSGAIIIFFFFWIWDNLREIGLDLQDSLEDYLPSAESIITGSILIILTLLVLFMLTAFIISLIRTVLKFFNLKMFRIGDGFVIESGLLNRREQAAKDHKIQVLNWSQNLLQKWTSIYELVLKQAASAKVSTKRSIHVAGLNYDNISSTQEYIFKTKANELNELNYQGVNSYYRYIKLYYATVFFLVLLGVLYYFQKVNYLPVLLLFYAFNILRAQLSYQKKKYAVTPNLVVIRGGTFGARSSVMLIYKIQSISLKASYFQTRRNLSSVIVHTASGRLVIPDILTNEAINLKNYMLYKVESSKLSWM